jgi:hypothetical protein
MLVCYGLNMFIRYFKVKYVLHTSMFSDTQNTYMCLQSEWEALQAIFASGLCSGRLFYVLQPVPTRD